MAELGVNAEQALQDCDEAKAVEKARPALSPACLAVSQKENGRPQWRRSIWTH
jgi:hypothetical protein